MSRFKVVSLFAGAGGLDWGFHTGKDYKIVFVNEIDKTAAQTYKKNFGKSPLASISRFSAIHRLSGTPSIYVGNVGNIDFGVINEIYGEETGISVVIGGPPCQDFSVVRGNNKKGTAVKRGKLYAHFLRAVKVLQPEIFVFENVPGLKFMKRGLPYQEIIKDFKELNLRWAEVKKAFEKDINGNGTSEILGYRLVFADIVKFSDIGVPQLRQRLIIIGVREDLIDEDTAEAVSREIKESLSQSLFSKYPLTPIEVLEGLPLNDSNLEDIYRKIIREYEGIWNEVKREVGQKWKENVWDKLSRENIINDYIISNNLSEKFDKGEFEEAMEKHREVLDLLGYYNRPLTESLEFDDGTHFETLNETKEVAERMKHIAFGENYQFVYGTKWSVEGKGISFVYRRLHPLKPAPTVVGRGGGGTRGYHYRRSRATLTNRERARLQTFPDSFLFAGTPPKIREQIGNAVPPLGSKWIAFLVSCILKGKYNFRRDFLKDTDCT